MLAATAARTDADDPLSCLEVGQRPEPEAPDGWTSVRVASASLNHHDLWTLRGVGLRTEPPVVLGCDAAGWDADGSPVVVHAVVSDPSWSGDETLDPGRSLLSEVHDGTLAEHVVVPAGNVVPLPPELSLDEAACLSTAWLTAYRMLFVQADLKPGQSVLVQGAGGGVATACTVLGSAAGLRVYVTSRSADKRTRAEELGAAQALETGARLPERVDAVMETVGRATWSHSLKALKPGGVVVVSGATSGFDPSADLNRVFFLQLRVLGSTMGTRDELQRLVRFLVDTGARPLVDEVLPLPDVRRGFERMAGGDLFGKVVVRVAQDA